MATMTEHIRKEIKKRLIDVGITQTDLAEQVGRSRQQVSDMLNGRGGNINEVWSNILDALGLELVVREKKK